jgi:hypothetical protein
MSTRNRALIVITTIIAMSGIFSVHRVVADSAGTSVTQADGSPTQIAAVARHLDAGDARMCALLETSALACLGLGSSGRLRSGSTSTLGDVPNEMGDNLTSVNLGTDRRVMSLTEPGRAGAPTGTAGDGSGKVEVVKRVAQPG